MALGKTYDFPLIYIYQKKKKKKIDFWNEILNHSNN